MDQEKIGQFIKKIREENNLTQKELADRLGVTFQAVSKWENGKNAPDLGILKQISDEFNVNIDEILSGKRSSKKDSIPILTIIITIVSIMLLVVFCVLKINQSDYEFKTISSKCKDFKPFNKYSTSFKLPVFKLYIKISLENNSLLYAGL